MLQYIVLYVLLMGVGFMFEPPLPYTQYPIQMTGLLILAIVLDFAQRMQGKHKVSIWEKY